MLTKINKSSCLLVAPTGNNQCSEVLLLFSASLIYDINTSHLRKVTRLLLSKPVFFSIFGMIMSLLLDLFYISLFLSFKLFNKLLSHSSWHTLQLSWSFIVLFLLFINQIIFYSATNQFLTWIGFLLLGDLSTYQSNVFCSAIMFFAVPFWFSQRQWFPTWLRLIYL